MRSPFGFGRQPATDQQVSYRVLTVGSTPVYAGDCLGQLPRLLARRRVFAVTDASVRELYPALFRDFPVYVVAPGEASKSLPAAGDLARWLLQAGADRSSLVLAVGGGVVTDLAAFAAASFMRGVDFALVATTLVAQVDAALGGKCGVDLDGYKNIVGLFAAPRFVLCHTPFLATLPEREWQSGLGEVVKHALIGGPGMLSDLERHAVQVASRDADVVSRLVTDSIELKARIVAADPEDRGTRAFLNLGHTFGHGIETLTGRPHGLCVAAGTLLAIEFGEKTRHTCSDDTLFDRVNVLFASLGVDLSAGRGVDPEALADAVSRDKKRDGQAVRFVLVDAPGQLRVAPVAPADIRAFLLSRPRNLL